MYRTLSYERRGATAHIILHGDSLSAEMHYDLVGACDELTHDDAVLVAVICGEPGRFPGGLVEDGETRGIRAVASVDRPVIFGLTGDVSATGLELALAGDLRIAAEGTRLSLPEVGAGGLPQAGGSQRLARLVGKSHALEMLLLAGEVDASEAYRIGLVNRVVAADQVAAEAERLAQVMATRAPIALRYAKEAVYKGLDMTLEQGLRLEMDLYLILQTTDDRTEGVTAFLERRTPHFQGK